jgi:hypothetical protein
MKHKLKELKGETGTFIIRVGCFNTSIPLIHRTTTQVNEEIEDLNNTISQ